jgi:hypothetical protein
VRQRPVPRAERRLAGRTLAAVLTAPSLDGRSFAAEAVSDDGEVSAATRFAYREFDGVVWASYSGGAIVRGELVGTRVGDGLDFRYVHLTADGQTAAGRCRSVVSHLLDGRLQLDETWTWESRPGSGRSTLVEQT